MYQDYENGMLGQVQREGVRINDDALGSGKVITWQELEFALRALKEATTRDGVVVGTASVNFSPYAKEHWGTTANMLQVMKYEARSAEKVAR